MNGSTLYCLLCCGTLFSLVAECTHEAAHAAVQLAKPEFAGVDTGHTLYCAAPVVLTWRILLVSADEAVQWACAHTMQAVARHAPDRLRAHAAGALPLAFFAKHATPPGEIPASSDDIASPLCLLQRIVEGTLM